MDDIRIAVVQMTSTVGDTAGNLDTIDRLTASATDGGAEIVCFPELSVSGYNTAERNGAPANNGMIPDAEPVPGDSTNRLCKIAKNHETWVVAGLLELDRSGITFNTQVVVSPEGLEGKYRKTHVPTTRGMRHQD